jgi:hypothetical protein
MRKYVALTAVAAAVMAIVVVPSIGSAQPTGQTLTLIAKQDSSYFPHHKPRPGDTFGFSDRESGGDTGRSWATCTIVGKGGGVCHVVVSLTKGDIAAQFVVRTASNGPPKHAIITGGTGAYNAAGGTVDIKVLSQTKNQLTFHFA